MCFQMSPFIKVCYSRIEFSEASPISAEHLIHCSTTQFPSEQYSINQTVAILRFICCLELSAVRLQYQVLISDDWYYRAVCSEIQCALRLETRQVQVEIKDLCELQYLQMMKLIRFSEDQYLDQPNVGQQCDLVFPKMNILRKKNTSKYHQCSNYCENKQRA